MKRIKLKRKTKLIKPFSIPEFCSLFNKHFQSLKGHNYLDAQLMLITRKIELDLIGLDDLLHKRHGNYENDYNMSMAELIEKEYGQQALLFVKSMIEN